MNVYCKIFEKCLTKFTVLSKICFFLFRWDCLLTWVPVLDCMHRVEAHAEGAEPHMVGHGAHTPRLEVHGGGRGEGLGEGGGVRHHAAQ